jgi:OOP family OmpA-OmpF porin
MPNKTYYLSLLFPVIASLTACQSLAPSQPEPSYVPYMPSLETQITTLIPPIPDSDADGILDDKDACPKTPKDIIVNEKGCPVNANPIGRLNMEVRIFFDYQGLLPRSSEATYNELNKVAIKMKKYPQATTAVFGNISTIEAQANPESRLAHDRAQLVKNILHEKGVPANSIQTFDCGDNRQIAPNDSEEAAAMNQRVYVRMYHNDEDDYMSDKDTYSCH